MAHYHARANVCRAGVTYAGLADHPIAVTIGGTDRTSAMHYNEFRITTSLDGSPSTCAFLVSDFAPTVGHTVTITMGGELIWGGTLTERRARVEVLPSGTTIWACQAIDWTWLLDRYARVFLTIGDGTSANTAIRRVLNGFTDPASGFRSGYMPSSLGTVDRLEFSGDTVSNAIRRICASAGCYSRLRPTKAIDAFTTLPTSNALTLATGSDARQMVYEQSFSQVRTRTYYAGGGSATTALVSAGATTIPVEECALYTGTQVLVGGDVIAYTGRSVASGPGSLTGVTGVDYEIPQGAEVKVLAQADDTTAQTALATLLGSSQSGIAVGWFSDGRLTQAEVDGRATADVQAFKSAIPALSFTTSQRWHEPGKTVAVSITNPFTISDTFRIQRVVMRPLGDVSGNTPSFEYQVACRVFRRADILDT